MSNPGTRIHGYVFDKRLAGFRVRKAVLVDVVCERDDATILPVCFVLIQAQIWTVDIFDLRLPTRRN